MSVVTRHTHYNQFTTGGFRLYSFLLRQVSPVFTLNKTREEKRTRSIFNSTPLHQVSMRIPTAYDIINSTSLSFELTLHPLFRRSLCRCYAPRFTPSPRRFTFLSECMYKHVYSKDKGTQFLSVKCFLINGACKTEEQRPTVPCLRAHQHPTHLRTLSKSHQEQRTDTLPSLKHN